MSKKIKFLIILIIVLVIIGLIFGISTIVRFSKLQSIWSRVNENIEKENYYMETTIVNKGVTTKTKTYYKDGIGKFVSQNGTYIWFDGNNAYSVNETEKTMNMLNPEEEIGVVYKESFATLYPGFSYNLFEKIMLAGNLSNVIKTQYFNGQKCIMIEIKEDMYTKTYWITDDFKNLVQAKISFTNGDVYEYKYDIKFHTTKLSDVELPNITDYKITDNATGKTIENINQK